MRTDFGIAGAVEFRLSGLRELVQEIRQATGLDVLFEDGDHGHMLPVCSLMDLFNEINGK